MVNNGKQEELSPYEQKRFAEAVVRAIKKGQPYVKVFSTRWLRGIGWYGETKRVEFASDQNFIDKLKESKNVS